MTNFDYKKYSLSQLDNWVNDAISCSEATPQEIYDTIIKVIDEQYVYFKQNTNRVEELKNLLSGNVESNSKRHSDVMCNTTEFEKKHNMSYSEAVTAGWHMTDDGFWIPPQKNAGTNIYD